MPASTAQDHEAEKVRVAIVRDHDIDKANVCVRSMRLLIVTKWGEARPTRCTRVL